MSWLRRGASFPTRTCPLSRKRASRRSSAPEPPSRPWPTSCAPTSELGTSGLGVADPWAASAVGRVAAATPSVDPAAAGPDHNSQADALCDAALAGARRSLARLLTAVQN